MPNWCNNVIAITGTKENMKEIYEFFRDANEEAFVMSSLVPEDDDFVKIKENNEFILSPYSTFYGTKWDFQINDIEIFDCVEESVFFTCSTAWSPPSAFCQRLSEKYNVEVDIKYEEGGVSFVGLKTYRDGNEIDSIDYDNYWEGLYNLLPDDFWSKVETYDVDGRKFDDVHKTVFPFIEDFEINELKELLYENT